MGLQIKIDLDNSLEEYLDKNTEDIVKQVIVEEVRKQVRKILLVRGFDYGDIVEKISNSYIKSLEK